MLEIHSNGSKWAGQAPDSIEKLIEVLGENTLDPTFEEYGNFIITESDHTRFFGNFYDVSHVFRIDTDDAEIIAKLTAAIEANKATTAYRQAARKPPKFKIGDRVTFTNDNGVSFPNKTIIGIEYWDGHWEGRARYFYEPSDSPWFSSREEHFTLEGAA